MSDTYYFRNVYKDDFQGAFLARYVDEVRGFKRVAIFYEVNDYSMGLMSAFMKEAVSEGLRFWERKPIPPTPLTSNHN